MTSIFINGLPQRVGPWRQVALAQSIGEFPFNWLPQRVGPYPYAGAPLLLLKVSSFHSIGCPSEWGPRTSNSSWKWSRVSIQLVAPASGAISEISCDPPIDLIKFPFNWLPQRVGPWSVLAAYSLKARFPFNWLPQRVGPQFEASSQDYDLVVSIQLVAPASGATI